MKTFFFWLWTVLVLVAWIGYSGEAVQDKVHTGSDLVFEVSPSRDLTIDAKGASIEAISGGYFLFSKPSGETIVGLPSEPPLEWEGETYYRAATEIQGGRWMIEGEETLKVHLTSPGAISARTIQSGSSVIVYSLIFVVAAFVWIVGVIFGAMLFED